METPSLKNLLAQQAQDFSGSRTEFLGPRRPATGKPRTGLASSSNRPATTPGRTRTNFSQPSYTSLSSQQITPSLMGSSPIPRSHNNYLNSQPLSTNNTSGGGGSNSSSASQINLTGNGSSNTQATALTLVLQTARDILESYEHLRIAFTSEESENLLHLNDSIASYLESRNNPGSRANLPFRSKDVLAAVSQLSPPRGQLVTTAGGNGTASPQQSQQEDGVTAAEIAVALTAIDSCSPNCVAEFVRVCLRFFPGGTFSLWAAEGAEVFRRMDTDVEVRIRCSSDKILQQVSRHLEPSLNAGRNVFPLIKGASLAGVLEMSAAPHSDPQVLQIMVNRATQLLNVQVELRSLHRQLEENKTLVTVAHELTRDVLDTRSIADSIVENVARLCEADRGSLFIRTGDELFGFIKGSSHVLKVPMTHGIAGATARTGRVHNIQDAYESSMFMPDVDKQTGYTTKSVLCVPIIEENSVVGVIQLLNKKSLYLNDGTVVERAFEERDEVVLTTATTVIALCLKLTNDATTLDDQKKRVDAMYHALDFGARADISDRAQFFSAIQEGAQQLLPQSRLVTPYLYSVDSEQHEIRLHLGEDEMVVPGSTSAGIIASYIIREKSEVERYECNAVGSKFNAQFDAPWAPWDPSSLVVFPLMTRDGKNNSVLVGVLSYVCQEEMKPVEVQMVKDFGKAAATWLRNFSLLDFTVKAGQAATQLSMSLTHTSSTPKAKLPTRGGSSLQRRRAKSVADYEKHNRDQVRTVAEEYKLLTQDFDIFALQGHFHANDLAIQAMLELFNAQNLLVAARCVEATMTNFLLAIRDQYRSVPYHNFFHAVDVCQTMYLYLFGSGGIGHKLKPLECFVLLVAGICHDVDHSGLNNNFHMQSDTPLGILSSASGTNSVLEVHHCNVTIEALSNPELNVFGGMTSAESSRAYRILVDVILSTDMARHKEGITAIENLAEAGWDPENEEQTTLVLQTILKLADISNVTKPFPISKRWAVLVTEEFHSQGDKEKDLGNDVQPLFDRNNADIAKSTVGFIQFVARPFFHLVSTKLFPGLSWTVENIDTNVEQWQR